MLQSALVALGAMLLSLVPAQTKQVSQAATSSAKRAAPTFGMSTGDDACEHLSREECCGQMLEIAGFEASGDQLPRRVKGTVKLACMGETRVVTRQMCKSIMMMRGFDAKQVKAACKPAHARNKCRKDEPCKQCLKDLSKLSYKGAHNACYAVTFTPEEKSRVVRIGEKAKGDSDTRFTITKRRRLH